MKSQVSENIVGLNKRTSPTNSNVVPSLPLYTYQKSCELTVLINILLYGGNKTNKLTFLRWSLKLQTKLLTKTHTF